MTVEDLLTEIKAEFEKFESARIEAMSLQTQLDAVFEELDQISEYASADFVNEHARLRYANAKAINESGSNDDEDQIKAEAKDLLSKSESEGLYDEDIPSLESILGKLKYITQLNQQLHLASLDLLDEARKLKNRANRSKPK